MTKRNRSKKRGPTAPPGPRATATQLPFFELAHAETVSVEDIVAGPDDALGKFMLTLALVFNDLKGAILGMHLHKLAKSRAEREEERGQLGGLSVQLARNVIVITRELVNLVMKRLDVVDSPEFRAILEELPPKSRTAWLVIENAARSKLEPGSMMKAIVTYRHNLAGHYDSTTDALAEGLRHAFSAAGGAKPGVEKLAHGKPAFSYGPDMDGTRFYFADAAASGAAEKLVGKTFSELTNGAFDLGAETNRALGPMVSAFIRTRRPTTGSWKDEEPLRGTELVEAGRGSSRPGPVAGIVIDRPSGPPEVATVSPLPSLSTSTALALPVLRPT